MPYPAGSPAGLRRGSGPWLGIPSDRGARLYPAGSRRDAEWFFQHLYDPTSLADWSTSPSYAHLFYDKEVTDETSPTALKLEGNDAPEPGFERVPHFDAIALVAYLESLKLDYDLPESKRVK